MEPTNIRFGGGAADTILNPLVAGALLTAITLIFALPRRKIVVPFLMTAMLVPFTQVVVLAGVHFTVYRILVTAGLIRLIVAKASGERKCLVGGISSIDKAFFLCVLFTFVTFAVQWMKAPAIIKALGNVLDSLGGYLVVRFAIQDREDFFRAVKTLVLFAGILAIGMTYERLTSQNIFAFIGGRPPAIRDGKLRAVGTFDVYITAGVFGATLVPLCLPLWSHAKAKTLALIGIAAGTIITIASSSSTPLLAFVAGLIGLCFWPIRQRMRLFRWMFSSLLIMLHLAMKAPVWALIARVDLTGSSSGYQRYMLVDQCIRHFTDWWLIGTKAYSNWGYDMWDLSNQYVSCAVTGGLVTIVTFILVISRSFGKLGSARKLLQLDRREEWLVWCLGAALLAHVVAYVGIGYFDQMQAVWYLFIAGVIAVVTEVSAVRIDVKNNATLASLAQTVFDGAASDAPGCQAKVLS